LAGGNFWVTAGEVICGGNGKNKSTPTDEVRESGASGKDTVITANCFLSFSGGQIVKVKR